MITLDQFRAGYRHAYDELFSARFRRFRDEGRRYDRAIVDHTPTLSFPDLKTNRTPIIL